VGVSAVASRASASDVADIAEATAAAAIDPHVAERSGLTTAYSLAGTLTMNDNRGVVGQTSGTSITVGYKLDAQTTLLRGPNEWRSSLFFAQGLTRTAKLPAVTKSQDLLRFETIVLRRTIAWLGPFARLAGDGPLLGGYDERSTPQDYLLLRHDRPPRLVTTQHLKLTDMARPFNLKESLGLFARLRRRTETNVELRLGGSARHTFADGQLAILDDPNTGPVDVAELESFHQLGPEATLAVWGAIDNGRVTYRAGVDLMVPSYRSRYDADPSATAWRLTNIDAFATVTVKVVDWASVDYSLRVVHQPQLLEVAQVQNNLLMTFGIQRAPKKKLEASDSPIDQPQPSLGTLTPPRKKPLDAPADDGTRAADPAQD